MTPRIPGQKPGGQQSLMDLLTPSLQAFVENLPILGDIVEAFTGREDGDPNDIGSKINAAKNWVAGLFGKTTSLASRVSAIEGKIATGSEFFDDFNRGDNTGSLGNGWVQGGEGQPLGIRDQAAMVIVGGVTATPGRRWAKSPRPASGDTFTVSMVVHPIAPSQYAETWLCARMNAAFTEGVAVRMVSGKAWLSRISRPSGTSNAWTTTDITPMSTKSYTQSATVEFKGEETILQVLIDSVVVLSATDTVHAIDAAHRDNGFVVQTTTAALGFAPSYSGSLASYSLKSVAVLASVSATAAVVATAAVAPVSSALTAASTGAVMPVDADPVVYAATKTVADNANTAAVASNATANIVQQNQQNANVGTGGLNRLLTFTGSGALSSTDWTADSAAFVVSSNQMALSGSAGSALYLARTNYTYATDNQAISARLGDNATNDQYTYIILRANAAGSTGVACRISANGLAIGSINFPGDGSTSSGFTAVSSVGRGLSSGDTVELRAVGNNFVVLLNGNSVVTYGGSLGSVGSGWRGASVVKQKAIGGFGFTSYSFNLSNFGMYDYGTVGMSATNRVNAKISRASASVVSMSLSNGGFALMPANYYTINDSAVGMAITDLSAGKVRVDIADWYEVSASFTARYQSNTAGENGDSWFGQSHFCLYVNDVQYTQALMCGVPHRFQFAQGDVVQVGVANLAAGIGTFNANGASSTSAYSVVRTASITGIAGGPGSFFQISKSYT